MNPESATSHRHPYKPKSCGFIGDRVNFLPLILLPIPPGWGR